MLYFPGCTWAKLRDIALVARSTGKAAGKTTAGKTTAGGAAAGKSSSKATLGLAGLLLTKRKLSGSAKHRVG